MVEMNYIQAPISAIFLVILGSCSREENVAGPLETTEEGPLSNGILLALGGDMML